MAKLLYLAGPIDYADEIEPTWREDVHELILKEPDWVCFDPARAFTIGDGTEPDRTIRRINQMCVGRSSAMIAFLPAGIQTFGTIEEITIAHHEGIPVAIVSEMDFAESWSLAHVPRFRRSEEALSWLLATVYNRQMEMDTVFAMKVLKLDDRATLPTRAHNDDAGFDLYSCEQVNIPPGEMRDIAVGIAIEPPSGYWFRIIGRSSTFRNRGLLMIEGIIDEGYRGPLYFGAYNTTDKPITVKEGERLCQAIPQRTCDHIGVQWTEVLTPSERGGEGFGSTGQ